MRHRPALALAILLLAGAAHASADKKPQSKKAGPARQGAPERASQENGKKADAGPARAQLGERRTALIDGMEGWTLMSRAEGPAFAPLTKKLEALSAELGKLEIGEDMKAGGKALDSKSEAFEALKAELLKQLFASKTQGQKLENVTPEARERFAGLAEKQALALREEARTPLVGGAGYEALKRLLGKAGSPESVGYAFDNDIARRGDVARALLPDPAPAQTAAEVSAPRWAAPAKYEPASYAPAPRAMAAERSVSYGAPAGDVAQSWYSAPPTPSVSPRSNLDSPTPPLEGSQSMSGKASWQREVLKRTGAWSLLSAVGVDPERFLRALTGAESGYATNTTSSAGAAGVMQVMPDTARGLMQGRKYREIAREYGLTVYNTRGMSDSAIQRMLNRDWRTNILLGILYIEDQARSFGGYVQNAAVSLNDKAKLMMNMVAGAYNAGPGRVFSALSRLRRQGLGLDDINPAQSLVRIRETKNYVGKILRDYGVKLFAETRGGAPDPTRT